MTASCGTEGRVVKTPVDRQAAQFAAVGIDEEDVDLTIPLQKVAPDMVSPLAALRRRADKHGRARLEEVFQSLLLVIHHRAVPRLADMI
jgi:hypothetical protein